MGRMREHPRYNVISMRISDEERETLQEIMQTTQKSSQTSCGKQWNSSKANGKNPSSKTRLPEEADDRFPAGHEHTRPRISCQTNRHVRRFMIRVA